MLLYNSGLFFILNLVFKENELGNIEISSDFIDIKEFVNIHE